MDRAGYSPRPCWVGARSSRCKPGLTACDGQTHQCFPQEAEMPTTSVSPASSEPSIALPLPLPGPSLTR